MCKYTITIKGIAEVRFCKVIEDVPEDELPGLMEPGVLEAQIDVENLEDSILNIRHIHADAKDSLGPKGE